MVRAQKVFKHFEESPLTSIQGGFDTMYDASCPWPRIHGAENQKQPTRGIPGGISIYHLTLT